MVKYSDNPDYTHEQMELSTAYDLRNARVVQAQINSIDAAENCAAITLAGECAELAEKSVEAVKFFYHCENSTGTVEDLARGYKAFKVNDFVIVLWVPASGEMEEQFYIIGHVDKRGTQRCKIGDLITFMMGLNYTFAPHTGIAPTERYVTIFDVSKGEVFDLGAFVPLPGSPPAPAALPCKVDEVWSAWVAYNFESPTPRHSCPLYAEEYDADVTVTSVVNIPIVYDGCDLHWRTNYSDGGYDDHLREANWFDLDSRGTSYRSVEVSREDYDVRPIGRLGWEFYDGVTGATHYAYVGGERTVLGDGSCILGGVVNATIRYSHNLRYKSTFDNIEIIKGSMSESVPFGPGFASIEYQDIRFTNRYCVSVSGEYGFYVLCGGSESYISMDLPTDNGIGTGGSVRDPCNEEIAFAQILLLPWEYYTLPATATHTNGLSYCMVALFDDVTGDKEYTLSPSRCLSVMNHDISRSMEEAFAPLKTLIFNLANKKRTWAWEKPTIGVLKKKEVISNA